MKSNIKKIALMSVLLLGLTGCRDNISNISSNANEDCNNKAQLLVEQNDRKIYTYCLNNATIKINDKEENLKNFIETDSKAIDKIINTLKLKDSFSDGGTKLYKGKNLTLVKCNTLDGNRDIYIGDQNMEFKQNFCDNDNYTFVRTYTVKSIKEYKEQQYTDDGTPVSYGNSFEVELYQFQAETKKVIINNLWDIKLEENKTYEFELQLYEDATNIEDSVEYIFKHSNIIEIRETDKIGLDQVQEPIKLNDELINVEGKYASYELVTNLEKNQYASTEILVKFDNVLYGKSYAIIDYAGGSEKIGVIDKLIDKKYVPKLNNETNSEEILNAEVYNKTEDSIVLLYNNKYVLFGKIK